MNTTKIQKWGNSYAVRLPKGVVEKAALKEHQEVEFSVTRGNVVLKKSLKKKPTSKKAIPKYSLKKLLKGVKPYPLKEVIDWGPDVGREILEPWEEKT